MCTHVRTALYRTYGYRFVCFLKFQTIMAAVRRAKQFPKSVFRFSDRD